MRRDKCRNNSSTPTISVLVPAFMPNAEWLKIAIDSVLRQSFDDFELLLLYEKADGFDSRLVDEYIEGIKDNRLRVIDIPQKSGLPKTLNIGLNEARGEFIARMDADDCCFPDRFENQIKYLRRHNEIVAVGSTIQIMNSRKIGFVYPGLSPRHRAVRMLFMNCGMPHPTLMVRHEFLKKNGITYNEEIKGSEDYHLWVDIIIHGGLISQISKPLLLYRVSDSQASVKFAALQPEWDRLAQDKLLTSIGNFTIQEMELIRQATGDKRFTCEKYEKIVAALVRENRSTHILDERSLNEELAFLYAKSYFSNSDNWFLQESESIIKKMRFVKAKYYPYVFWGLVRGVYGRLKGMGVFTIKRAFLL